MARACITVDSATLDAAKVLLVEGESLRQFIDLAIHQAVSRRQVKVEFLNRGMAACERARITGEYRDLIRSWLDWRLSCGLEEAHETLLEPATREPPAYSNLIINGRIAQAVARIRMILG